MSRSDIQYNIYKSSMRLSCINIVKQINNFLLWPKITRNLYLNISQTYTQGKIFSNHIMSRRCVFLQCTMVTWQNRSNVLLLYISWMETKPFLPVLAILLKLFLGSSWVISWFKRIYFAQNINNCDWVQVMTTIMLTIALCVHLRFNPSVSSSFSLLKHDPYNLQ